MRFSFADNHASLKRIANFTTLFFLISILIGSSLYLGMNFSFDQRNADDQFQNSDYDVSPEAISNNSEEQSDTGQSYQGSNLGLDNAVVETETKSSADYAFLYNENVTYKETFIDSSGGSANQVDVTTTYDSLRLDVDAFTNKSSYTKGVQGDGFAPNGDKIIAQGVLLEEMNYSGSTVNIDGIAIEFLFGNGQNYVGDVYTSVDNGTHIIPDTSIASVTSTSPSFAGGLTYFSFGQNYSISTDNTYWDTSGAILFFTFRKVDTSTGWGTISTDTSNDFETYTFDGAGDPPLDPPSGNWVGASYDIIVNYNASFTYNPVEIDSKVTVSGVDSFIADPISYHLDGFDTASSFILTYDGVIPNSPTVQFNVTYTGIRRQTASVTYNISPVSGTVNWTIYHNSVIDLTGDEYRSLLIPKLFTVQEFWHNETLETEGVDYTVENYNSVNNSVIIDSSNLKGNYTFVAQSTNLFTGLSGNTYKYDSNAFISSSNGSMGTVIPSIKVGDRVKSNFTVSGVNIVDGTVNASLRTQAGVILGNQTTQNYVDQYNSTTTYDVLSSLDLEYETWLDPNITAGIYTFQYFWTNNTAAGAISIEFNVIPVTTIQLLSHPSTFNALEGSSANLVIGFNDLSHNDTFTTANWLNSTIQNNTLSSGVYNPANDLYEYPTTYDLTGLSIGTYTLNASFTEGSFTNYSIFSLNLYHVGSAEFNDPGIIEYGNDFSFTFKGQNQTISPTDVDTSAAITSIQFDNDQTSLTTLTDGVEYSTTYGQSGPDEHNITINWEAMESQLERGSNNRFTINWDIPGLRDDPDSSIISSQISIIIQDSTKPLILAPTSLTLSEDQSIGYELQWNVSDDFPGTYQLLNETNKQELNTSSWSNTQNITYTLTDGLLKGSYTFNLTAYDDDGNKDSQLLSVTVNDERAPDQHRSPGDRDISLDLDLDYIHWNFTDNHPGIYELYIDGELSKTGSWNNSDFMSFFVGNVADGQYNYELRVYDEDNNLATNSVTLTIDRTRPSVTEPNREVRVFNNETSTYTLTWTALDNNPDTYQIYRNGTAAGSGAWTSGSTISVDIGSLSLGVYNFTLVLTDDFGNTRIDMVTLTVKLFSIVETDEINDLGITTEVYEGDVDGFSGTWNKFNSDDGISNASIVAVLTSADPESDLDLSGYRYVTQTGTDGSYTILLDYTNLQAGDYVWTITFAKASHENRTVTEEITVLTHDVDINLSYPDNLIQGENFTIIITVNYRTFNGSGLGLDAIQSRRSGGVANVTIRVVISYINQDGDSGEIIRFSQLTNAQGQTKITLSSGETRVIESISSISASVDQGGFIGSSEITLSDATALPVIEQGAWDLNEVADIAISVATEFWYVIVIVVILSLIIISFFTRRSRKRREFRKNLIQEMEIALDEVRAIQSISGILGKNSESGIPFFYMSFDDEDVDMSLVSGLTTALSSFLSEIQEGAKGFETMERQGISLTSHRLDVSDMIVVSQEPLPMHLLSYIQAAHEEIEERYGDQIDNVAMSQGIDEEKILEILTRNDLKVDLKFKFEINEQNIRKVQNQSDYSKNIRVNIGLIHEFAQMVKEANLPITLSALMDYLISVDINEEVAARIVLISRANNIIEPIIDFEEADLDFS